MDSSAKGALVTINIDGKPLEKLIEVVSSGIGTLYRPRKIRKEADAQAYAIKVIEKAKAEAGSETKLIEVDTAERIGQRLAAKEVRRQENIDSVVEMAAKELSGTEVSDKPVEEDWSSRFFDIVQDVSRDEMKALWAKILAKEIQKPSSYSLRTLEVLRNLSYEEAEMFVKLSEFVVKHGICFVFCKDKVLDKYGLKYYYLAKLREAGLLQSETMVTKTFSSGGGISTKHTVIYGNIVIFITLPGNSTNVLMPIYLLSQAGLELYELTEHKENMRYLNDIAAFVKSANPSATFEYGRIIEINDEQVKYELPLKTI